MPSETDDTPGERAATNPKGPDGAAWPETRMDAGRGPDTPRGPEGRELGEAVVDILSGLATLQDNVNSARGGALSHEQRLDLTAALDQTLATRVVQTVNVLGGPEASKNVRTHLGYVQETLAEPGVGLGFGSDMMELRQAIARALIGNPNVRSEWLAIAWPSEGDGASENAAAIERVGERAISHIRGVHDAADGVPPVLLEHLPPENARQSRGGWPKTAGDDSTLARIVVDPTSPYAVAAFIRSYGYCPGSMLAKEHEARHVSGIESEDELGAAYTTWWSTIQQSPPMRDSPREKGALATIRDDPAYSQQERTIAGGWLTPQRAWARSYLQWVADESNDPVLTEQFTLLRADYSPGIRTHAYWSETEFPPIAAALRAIFPPPDGAHHT